MKGLCRIKKVKVENDSQMCNYQSRFVCGGCMCVYINRFPLF